VKWLSQERKNLVTTLNDRSGLQRRDLLRSTSLSRRLIRLVAQSTDPALPAQSIVATWGTMNVPIRTLGQTLVGVPFAVSPVRSGRIGAAGGATMMDPAASWQPDQWITSPHAVRLLTGSGQGRILPILGNDAQSLTVDATVAEQAHLLADVSYEILPLRTLNTIFRGPRKVLVRHVDADRADLIGLWNGVGFDGYYDNGEEIVAVGNGSSSGAAYVLPEEGISIQRQRMKRTPTMQFFGVVPPTPQIALLGEGTSLVANQFPAARTLAQSGLSAIPGLVAADQVRIPTRGKYQSYTFDGNVWRRVDGVDVQKKALLLPGGAIFVDRTTGGESTWTQPPPF